MKQYCRYCVFCFEADDFRCSNHPQSEQPHWTRKDINRENHCPNFQLHPDGDIETGKPYKPHTKHNRQQSDNNKVEQLSLFIQEK